MGELKEPQTLLAALMAREQLTLDEAARKVSDASLAHERRPTSVTARHLGRLARRERPDARPQPAVCRALQHAFGRSVEELLAPYDPAALVAAVRGPTPSTPPEVLTIAANRARHFVTQLQTTSDEALELVWEDVRDLAQAYPNRPLHELLGHLVSGQDTVFTLLERPQRPEHARQLYFLAAVLGGMLSKASHDLADPHAALVQSRTAWLCAEQADHHGLRAWVSGLQSLIAYWARRPQESIRYAQRGAQHAGLARSTASIWLLSNEARAWAAIGNGTKAREAIQRADASWAQVESDDLDELGGIATFSRPRALYYAADALAWLPGSAENALDYADQAVAAYADPLSPDWAFGDAAGSRCDLAIARLYSGDVDGAADAMTPVLALPPEQRINGIVHSVNRVSSALAPLAVSATTATLQDEIEAYARTPLQALPR